jgi:hypothetical protein
LNHTRTEDQNRSRKALKKITIVNRHYPPNVNITGENAWDLANYLISTKNIDVAIVHIGRSYEGGGNQRKPVGKVHTVSTIYEGQNKILRYLSGMLDGWKLIRKAASLDHGPVIVMTSPPLLPMWASRIFTRRKIEWMLWSMDLFPEGFAATGEIGSDNFLYRYALEQTYKNPPSKIIALGPQQKAALEKKYGREIGGVVIPCGVFMEQSRNEIIPAWKTENGKIYFGYCGNCGNPHSAEFIKIVMDKLDPARHHMILAVYGNKADEVKRHAAGKNHVTILQGVPRNELHHIDVHLVTLVNSWTHVAVPSKAVSSVCSGATILFCGSQESDNWYLLQDAGWHVADNHKLSQNVEAVISSIDYAQILARKNNARLIAERLSQMIRESYDTIAQWAK